MAAGVAAITLMLTLATQIVAAAFGYHPALGDPVAITPGAKLYAPWMVLFWTVYWAPHDLGAALVLLAVDSMALLAAFAVAALAAAVEPTALVLGLPRGCLERWAKLSQSGLLRDNGVALGAVRRLGLGRRQFIRCSTGNMLMLGDPAHTEDALIAAVSSAARRRISMVHSCARRAGSGCRSTAPHSLSGGTPDRSASWAGRGATAPGAGGSAIRVRGRAPG